MEKIYKLLDWLSLPQAVDWLQDLTATHIEHCGLIQLCEANQCSIYIDCPGVEGWGDGDEGVVSGTSDMQKVLNPKALRRIGQSIIEVNIKMFGAVWVLDPFSEIPERCEIGWEAKISLLDCMPYFKSADIRSLAERMNEVVEPLVSNEAQVLHVQLNEERNTRGHIQAQAEKLQQELTSVTERLDRVIELQGFLYKDLDDERLEKEEAQKRAEHFEALLANNEHAKADTEHWRQMCEREREGCESFQAQVIELQNKLGSLEREVRDYPSRLLAVAGLLELLLDDSRPRHNQTTVADSISALHPDWRGVSISLLTKLFAEANAAAKEANLEARAKVEMREAAAIKARGK